MSETYEEYLRNQKYSSVPKIEHDVTDLVIGRCESLARQVRQCVHIYGSEDFCPSEMYRHFACSKNILEKVRKYCHPDLRQVGICHQNKGDCAKQEYRFARCLDAHVPGFHYFEKVKWADDSKLPPLPEDASTAVAK